MSTKIESINISKIDSKNVANNNNNNNNSFNNNGTDNSIDKISENNLKNNSTYNYPIESLEEVRSILKNNNKESKNSLDLKLYNRLLTDDALLNRYMRRRRGDPEASALFIENVLKWRKSMGIDNITESSFPKEFFKSGGMFILGEDKNRNTVLYIRVSNFHKIPDLVELLKQFIVYMMTKADELGAARGPNVGWILVIDCSKASVSQGDPEMLSFINQSLKNYFPAGQMYILVVNLNWILRAIKTLAFTWYPAAVKNRIKFCSDKEITQYIPKSQLPEHLGGPESSYIDPPKSCLSLAELKECGKLSLSQETLNKIEKLFATAQ